MLYEPCKGLVIVCAFFIYFLLTFFDVDSKSIIIFWQSYVASFRVMQGVIKIMY